MHLSQILPMLDAIAPTRHAEAWDNVGLLAGDPAQTIHKILLTIDYTPAVAEEARALGCDLVIAYHPPLFQAIKTIRADGPNRLIFDAIARGVAIYSPHTALDVAEGGTNDHLADVLGLQRRQPLRTIEGKSTQYKLVVFVPKEALGKVSDALFAAGCGVIGNYSRCSFQMPGVGTFLGEAGANPTVGQAGKMEETHEIRLETVVPIQRLNEAIQALRASHPYEEPAFDLVQLAAAPEGLGQGRIGTWDQPQNLRALLERVARELGVGHLLIAGPRQGTVQKAAVCAGACGDLLNDALAQGAQLFLTGEMRHHDALRAAQAGMTVVCALHSNSERVYLPRLAERLARQLPLIPIVISQRDADPFVVQPSSGNNERS